jgi:5-methylthioadenosine/S-adenosylhomocysteine deaminase
MSSQGQISRRSLLGAAAALGAAGLAAGAQPAHAARPGRQGDRPAASLPPRGEFVVRGAYVLTMDPALGDLPVGDVHVRGGEIVAVGPSLATPGAAVIDGKHMIAMPGFVETHWHLWNTACRALVRVDDPEYGYFPVTVRLGPAFTPEDSYRAVRLGVAEALYSGITTAHDWCHNVLTPAHADAELSALRDLGIRARFSYGPGQGYPTDRPMDAADLARVQREWLAAPNEGLLTLGVASRTPGASARGTVSIEVLRQDWEAARRLGLPITHHVSAPGAVSTMEDAGLLGPDVQLVHPMTTTAAEREVVVARGMTFSIAALLESRMPRAVRGAIQFAELEELRVPMSLSLDTTAATANADFFNSMRMLVASHNQRLGEQMYLEPRRLLKLATIDGARDLGIADRTGSLTPGKRADLILVRTTDVNLAPVLDPAHSLVYAAQPANVDTVVVDGRILRRGGEFTALDQERVVAEATESLLALHARVGWP